MAAASGLMRVPPAARNPLRTNSRGTGELIRAALDAGARRFILGIAGSLGANVGVVHTHGIDTVFSVLSTPCTLDEALADAAANIERTARNVAAVLQIGVLGAGSANAAVRTGNSH